MKNVNILQVKIMAEEKDNQANTTVFKSLAPVESDSYSNYQDAFEYALSNDNKTVNITNIAVTGPYASGKSSVIEKVKNNFDKDKFITLSLTNFNSGSNEENTEKEENKKLEEDLEAQLINQLIHKIDSNKIKDSRFLVNKKIDTSKLSYKVGTFIHALIISIIFICLIIFNLNDETISKIFFSKIDDIKSIAINILLILGSIYFLYFTNKTITLFKKRRILKKVNIYGNEIELFSSEEESIFDKYTDEILYLFEKSGANIFIFEDIDRYEDVTIFKKLREINILLNDKIKRENNKKAPIKFIYVISDNMFTAEERTKFFDFIISVVPYIHKGNAYDNLLSFFPDEIKDERNKKFLIKISLFIDNSRLIKNIANEYYIYNKFIKLKDREPHTKFIKLLSLIIYKNLFPKDFNQLYFNKGYLAELFNKEEFAKDNELTLDNLKYKTIKECIEINEDSNKFFKAPKGYDYIYNGGYFNLIKFLVKNGYIDETYKDYMSEITENSLTYEERVFLQNIASHNGIQYNLPLERIKEKEYLDNLLTFIDEEDFNRIEILNIDLVYSVIDNDYMYKLTDNLLLEEKTKYKYWINLLFNKIKENKWYEFWLIYIEYFSYNLTDIEWQQQDVFKNIFENYDEIADIAKKDEELYNKFSYFTINVFLEFTEYFKNNNHINLSNINKYKEKIVQYITNDKKFIEILDKYYSGEDSLFEEDDLTKISHSDIYNFINILSECNIKFNDIREINKRDLYNIIFEKQIFIVNYDNIIYIIKHKCNKKIESTEVVFKSILEMQDNRLQLYIFENFYTFIQTFPMIIQYETINDEIYEQIILNKNIPDNAQELFKTKFFKQSDVQNVLRK